MLEEKKINSEEAAQLLRAIEETGAETSKKRGKTLKLRVYEGDPGNPKVNINIPLSWIKFVFPFIKGKIAGKLNDRGLNINIDEIYGEIEKGDSGKIRDVQDGNEKVQIYIE